MTADLVRLRELAKRVLNTDGYEKVKLSIDSLSGRLEYAKYHYQQYKKLIDNKTDIVHKMKFMFSLDNSEQSEKIAIKANIIACMQNMHILHDILGYLICFSLNLQFDKERQINFSNVKNKIDSSKKNEYKNLLILLEIFSSNSDYKYLEDNVNHSKHKFQISPNLFIDMRQDECIHCEFTSFTHNENFYDKRDVDNFLNVEFNRELNLIIEIENELIKILEEKIGEN